MNKHVVELSTAIGNLNFVLADAKGRLTPEELQTLRDTRLILQGLMK